MIKYFRWLVKEPDGTPIEGAKVYLYPYAGTVDLTQTPQPVYGSPNSANSSECLYTDSRGVVEGYVPCGVYTIVSEFEWADEVIRDVYDACYDMECEEEEETPDIAPQISPYEEKIGDDSSTRFVVIHNFGVIGSEVRIFDCDTGEEICATVTHINENQISVEFADDCVPKCEQYNVIVDPTEKFGCYNDISDETYQLMCKTLEGIE